MRADARIRISEEGGALLVRLRNGDRDAFREVLEQEWDGLVAYAFRLVDDADLAEDLAQRALVRLWRRRTRLDPEGSVRALLYRTTRNLALDRLRVREGRRRLRSLLAAERTRPAPADARLRQRELRGAIDAAVEDLTPRRQEAFRLCRVHGLSQEEAAEVMGLTKQTVANHVTAALRHIRQRLAPHLD